MGRAEDLFERLRNEGEAAVESFIDTRQSEELFLDFKRSADSGSGTKLHDNDRQNLAKAISGFGNSEGGIIVWGIDCSPNSSRGDVACSKALIENPRRFVSWLEGAVSGCTVPPHTGVTHLAIDSKANNDSGCVVTLVPKSYDAPHQCIKPPQYYIRAGSNFVPTPHAVLSGMFGRRPQPFLFHFWLTSPAKLLHKDKSELGIQFGLGLGLSSRGPGLASDVYVNLTLFIPKTASQATVKFPDQTNWHVYQAFGCSYSLVSATAFRIAPDMAVQPLVMNFHLQSPFQGDLHYRIAFGHRGSPVQRLEARTSSEEIERAILDFKKSPDDPLAASEVVRRIMQIKENSEQITPREDYHTW